MDWHSQSTRQLFQKFKTPVLGLSEKEAKKRWEKVGANELPSQPPLSGWKVFLRQFNNPLVFVLLAVISISFFLQHYSDSIFILIVLLINTVVGFYQENKTNHSLDRLKKMVKVKTRVVREGREREIDAKDLALGDLIVLKAGDKVPADGRILETEGLEMNEAMLTGEAGVVMKQAGKVKKETILAERSNMVFAGTAVEGGEARVLVTAVGIQTEIGKIVKLVKQTEEPYTLLQKRILRFSKMVGLFILLLVGVIIVEGLISGQPWEEIFISALALAVSSIPEGLLPAITVVLVLAMQRILKKKGVVKKLSAAEGLGSVTVVCTDKTGTLTEGKMEVSRILTSRQELLDQESAVDRSLEANGTKGDLLALKIATLTNDAYIENPKDEFSHWKIRGYWTDRALLMAGIQAGLNLEALEKKYPLIKKWNFDSRVKLAASWRKKDKEKVLFVVGAPEEIVRRSIGLATEKGEQSLSEKEREKINKKLETLTRRGLRVVACGYRQGDLGEQEKKIGSLAQELVFVGLIALRDPIRKDAKTALKEIERAGVRPIIITGDHKYTAQAVAEKLGLKVKEKEILEGKEVDELSDTQLKERVKEIKIYARVLPEQKLRIVKALHRHQEVVAMFGDGVNDAPALKAADIGVAVGSGTDVAKEVADVILLDDNFKTIVEAIKQGRLAFNNIRKVIIYLIADDFTEILLFLGALALGLPLPLIAAQILWINLIEDGFPDIALTTEKDDDQVMNRPPRDPNEPILSWPIKQWMLAVFLINGLVTFVFFLLAYQFSGEIERARTLVFTLMAFDSLVFAFSVRSLRRTIFRRDIFSNFYLDGAVLISFVLLLMAIYVPFFQSFLQTVPLTLNEWLAIVALTIIEIIVFEFCKLRFLVGKHGSHFH